nr:CPBP family intramembrane glutamic endopeptidase [uncultured Oribacterium sp.]
MKLILKRILESFVLIAISAALWQFILFPVADTVNTKSPMSLPQNIYIIFGIGVLVFLINWYSKKQGYLNWWIALSDSSTKKWILFGLVSTVILHFLSTFVGYIEGIPYLVLSNDSHGYYMSIDLMTTLLLAPLAEELVFRKILIEVIFPKNLKVSLLITGILFTAFHFPMSAGEWVNQIGAAIVLSIIYYKTRKVEVGIIVHSIMNLFIASLMLWAMYK